MTLRTLNYGNYGIFLIMGNAGFCPSTVVVVVVVVAVAVVVVVAAAAAVVVTVIFAVKALLLMLLSAIRTVKIKLMIPIMQQLISIVVLTMMH